MILNTSLPIQPHLYIGDSKGRPLDSGQIFIGEANKDPEQFPINVFYDEALTISAAQPIRTKGGFIINNGNFSEVYAAEQKYSVKALNAYGEQVFYKPSMDKMSVDSAVNTKLPYALSIVRSQAAKNADTLSIADFGAKAGSADQTTNINNSTANGISYVPHGNYIASEAGIDRSRLYGPGSINGIRVGYDFGQSLSLDDFGAVGGNAAKDTAALKKAILLCKEGGVFAGKAIRVPTKTYLINEVITIDAPVNIFGLSSGVNSDGMQAPILKFTSTSGFNFVDGAGYCHFKDLRLVGTKKGGLDIPNNVFGNYGMQFTQGAFGMFENIRIEYFDVGRTAVKGTVWAGAYRFYNYCKFRDNTYSIVQQGYSTDENFFQCDFRASEASKAGYIYIDARGVDYQTTNFIDCMFELLGNNNLVSGKRPYSQFGMQIYGKSIVKIIGGYSEMCPTFVDKGASLVSTVNIVGSSNSLIHAGGGLINLDGAFARSNEYVIGDFSDTTYWELEGVTYDGIDIKDGIPGHQFTITAASNHFLEAKGYDAYRKASMNTIPLNPQRLLALVELEYQAPMGKTVVASFDSYSVDTWSDSTYYDNTTAWRRKFYTAPIALTESGGVRNTERVRIIFPNAAIGTKYFIRQCAFKILAE